MGLTSALRITGCAHETVERMYLEIPGVDLADDQNGTRAIFDRFSVDIALQHAFEFPTEGNGAGGTFINLFDNPFRLPHPLWMIGLPLSAGSDNFLRHDFYPAVRSPDILDFDLDRFYENVRAVNPTAEVFELSARTGEGIDPWLDWLRGVAAD